jgi:DNA-binding response OmpR family regulator/S1-C subfamily serine protease
VATQLETIVLIEAQAERRDLLQRILQDAGYTVRAIDTVEEGLKHVLSESPDVAVLVVTPDDARVANAISEIREIPTVNTRLVVLTSGGASERARVLQVGANDALSEPWEEDELLARIRVQMRQKRTVEELKHKVQNAEETYQVAQTAFQALAVTEKMTRDAFSLERILKIGVISLFSLALVIAGIFFLFSRKADKETRRAYSVVAQLEHGVKNQEELLAATRKMRENQKPDVLDQKDQLVAQTETLKKKISSPDNGSDVGELRKQLTDTTNRLNQLAGNSQAAEGVIRSFAPSVCLLHVSVAFNEKDSGKRIRYGGINADGSPLKDSDGNPVYTTEGRAPEVRADFFGTGFIVGEGKILTNHHVVQPWWQNEELAPAIKEGLQPVIADMSAYFPGEASGIPVGISQISDEADLALVHGDLSELHRPILKLDPRSEAAVSGEALISVGYATGLDAILARAGDEIVQDIVKVSSGDPKLVLAELAKRKLIRPLVTQGHVGDVLPDKIVYDAQTTSGGSGGPLLVREGGVIGVTYAIVKGFGGSNFGIPIRFAVPLLKR